MTSRGILVTGTGGGAGQGVLKALQESSHRVIAVDSEPLAAGLYSTGRGYVVPYASDSTYIPRLLEICRAEGIGLIFPGLDAELLPISTHRTEFQSIGVIPVVSSAEVITTCDDKASTTEFLRLNGLASPKTSPLDYFAPEEFDYPLVLKPRVGGARSKGVREVHSVEDLISAKGELAGLQYVAQELIEGPEYTCGTISMDGRCYGSIVLRRILRDGDTYKAFVERDTAIESFVEGVVTKLKPFGPCNVQLRVRDGVPYIFEFNGRFSGTTYCRALAGFNEPVMVADYLLSGKQPAFERNPITVVRYWKELVLENEPIERCRDNGHTDYRSQPL